MTISTNVHYNDNVLKKQTMAKGNFLSKFRGDLKQLTAAVEGSCVLDEDYPRLYQKVLRYYEDRGIQLYDDPEDDYNVIIDQVEADLTEVGVFA